MSATNQLFDPVMAQADLTLALLSASQIETVNVKSYRVMRIKNELDYRTLLTTPRNGRCGAGVIVCQPVASGRNPGVTGPILDWTFPIIAIEQPDINMRPATGTLIECEDLAQRVLDVVHRHADDLQGTFQIESNAIKPETQFVFPGCVSYRTQFSVVGKAIQTPRVANLALAVDAGILTLSCPTLAAEVRYTTDGSFPSRAPAGNSASMLYTGPFEVFGGQRVRARAYKQGFNGSAVRLYDAPAA